MQLKCKACDSVLTFYDYGLKKNLESVDEEDLCSRCRDIVFLEDDLDVKEYALEHITENWKNFTNYNENS